MENKALLKESNELNARIKKLVNLVKSGKASEEEIQEWHRAENEVPIMRKRLLAELAEAARIKNTAT